ncbi:hypothetical protein ACJX0J_028368 [Zea mays]
MLHSPTCVLHLVIEFSYIRKKQIEVIYTDRLTLSQTSNQVSINYTAIILVLPTPLLKSVNQEMKKKLFHEMWNAFALDTLPYACVSPGYFYLHPDQCPNIYVGGLPVDLAIECHYDICTGLNNNICVQMCLTFEEVTYDTNYVILATPLPKEFLFSKGSFSLGK